MSPGEFRIGHAVSRTAYHGVRRLEKEHILKRLAALTITSLLALSACSGGGTTASRAPGALAPSGSKAVLTAYRVPLTHNAAVDAAAALGAAKLKGERGTQGLGGAPTVDGTVDALFAILDAPRFGPNAQINVAILGVQAVGADGVAYSIVSYAAPVVVNMLDYKTTALVLGHASIPNQSYSILRLVVQASTSSVLAWGHSNPVTFGSYDHSHSFTAAPADITSIDFPVQANSSTGSMTILADFNTLESVKIRNGMSFIGSRIAAAPYDSSSIIVGNIVNKAGSVVPGAIVAALDTNGNVVATTIAADDGSFELHAIVGGTYQIMVYNNYVASSGDEFASSLADSTDDFTGPQISVPGGYKVSLGNIVD